MQNLLETTIKYAKNKLGSDNNTYLDQTTAHERAKLGPDNSFTAYIYICVYICTHTWVSLSLWKWKLFSCGHDWRDCSRLYRHTSLLLAEQIGLRILLPLWKTHQGVFTMTTSEQLTQEGCDCVFRNDKTHKLKLRTMLGAVSTIVWSGSPFRACREVRKSSCNLPVFPCVSE